MRALLIAAEGPHPRGCTHQPMHVGKKERGGSTPSSVSLTLPSLSFFRTHRSPGGCVIRQENEPNRATYRTVFKDMLFSFVGHCPRHLATFVNQQQNRKCPAMQCTAHGDMPKWGIKSGTPGPVHRASGPRRYPSRTEAKGRTPHVLPILQRLVVSAQHRQHFLGTGPIGHGAAAYRPAPRRIMLMPPSERCVSDPQYSGAENTYSQVYL